ncbi:MAG: sulfite exporter TauE/SafE family protein [Deltaproteobacteria bacterium]|nr:sulfite exporter TauE/SafE family protein [Deltaproteobacteria bacterium]
MTDSLALVILFASGIVAGILNVIAGGGSMLTLPLLIFLGLPTAVANGTNRIAILVQNIGAVWGFQRHGLIDHRWLVWAGLPAIVGAAAGSWMAVGVSDSAFRRILAVIMILVAIWMIWDPLKNLSLGEVKMTGKRQVLMGLIFLLVGFHGGFIQAGIGFVVLAVVPFAGIDMVRGNALKVLIVLIFTPIALSVFAINGKIDWAYGSALAAGNLLGGLLGVRLTVLMGHRWIKSFVLIVVLVLAAKLWLTP